MKIGKRFNQLTVEEYFLYIDNYKKYTDFNTLGLYRSIVENNIITSDDKIVVREYAHKTFKKTFDFLQLKDPKTYVEVSRLGLEFTKADEQQVWNDIIKEQQKILADKRIRHRNFGEYSKHNCGYDTCVFNGIMIRQGSWLSESNMHFSSDKNKYMQKLKSDRRRSGRKTEKEMINRELNNG